MIMGDGGDGATGTSPASPMVALIRSAEPLSPPPGVAHKHITPQFQRSDYSLRASREIGQTIALSGRVVRI